MRGSTIFKETKRLKTVTSATASSHAPGASAEGQGCVDPAAHNSSSPSSLPPPPRHHNISLSLPEESPLFLMHLCSGHGGGLPSAPHLLHAIAHAWPRGQYRWKGPENHNSSVSKAENTWRVQTTDHRCASMAIAGCLVPNPSTSTACHTGSSSFFFHEFSLPFFFLLPLSLLCLSLFLQKGAVVSIGSHMKHIPAHFVSLLRTVRF